MLKINSLDYSIQDQPLFEALSFHLKQGENLCILGENGIGKSTLAKLLCGLIPSQRAIMIQGRYIEDIPAKKRARYINYIPAKLEFYDGYVSVSDFLKLSSLDQAICPKESEDTLSLLGLKSHKNATLDTLSSGESQLLLLASALIQNAQLTIFDEPTANLDPKKTKQVFSLLKSKQHFKQIILITHDLQLAYKLDLPILYLDKGKTQGIQKDFFEAKNLAKHFDDTIMILQNNIVRKL
jgi:iron complex transport system ATP-binding protein